MTNKSQITITEIQNIPLRLELGTFEFGVYLGFGA